MRDGDWKLVRPAIAEAMHVSRTDFAMDVDAKYHPEKYTDIVREPLPVRVIGAGPPSQLFDLRADPLEQHDLAAAQPERVARMERELTAWFAEVESERRAIADERADTGDAR